MSEFSLRPFTIAADDPYAAEHEIVSRRVTEAIATLLPNQYYKDVPLKETPAGQLIFDADAEQGRRFARATLQQVAHWDAECDKIRAQGKNAVERANPHLRPGWSDVWGRRRRTAEILLVLVRRNLPFTEDDLVALLASMQPRGQLFRNDTPYNAIVKAVERFTKDNPLPDALRSAAQAVIPGLRDSYSKDAKRAANTLGQLCAGNADAIEPAEPTGDVRPVVPTMAGHPAVMSDLKRNLKMTPDAPPADITLIDPDRFPLRGDSPYRSQHQLLSALFTEAAAAQDRRKSLLDFDAGRQIAAMTDLARGKVMLAACERVLHGLMNPVDFADQPTWRSHQASASSVSKIADAGCGFDRAAAADVLLYFAVRPAYFAKPLSPIADKTIQMLAADQTAQSLSEGERFVLSLVRTALVSGPPMGTPVPEVQQLNRMIADGEQLYLVPSEHWSVMVNHDIAALPAEQRGDWVALLRHCLTATSPRPSDKWLKTATKLANEVGIAKVRDALKRWFAAVPIGRATVGVAAFQGDARTASDTIHEENACVLRGFLWLAPGLKGGDDMMRSVTTVAQSAYKKVPGVGPRAVKVGNAAVYALSQMNSAEAVGQLAMLKVRVKFGTAQKEIEKAFNAAAEALSLPRAEIEELGIPTYGMEEVGIRRETFGEASAELRVDGRDVAIAWTGAGGKPLKSVPAKVKSDFKEDLKELQGAAKDIAAMLPAQSERLDAMFLSEKSWPYPLWRERYLDHPLIGTLARRLIWTIGDRAFAWHDSKLIDAEDRVIEPSPTDEVRLWHPIGRSTEQVLAWRRWLERHEVRQPFKQAHREVYLLTDAERRTNTYSNRFAAHVLRQHQFKALCDARGWKSKLRLMVDDTYPPPSRDLSRWGLRAEFWIESIGDNYGVDTNDSGAYLRVATDQVRFYRTGAAQEQFSAGGGSARASCCRPGTENLNEPLPLDQILLWSSAINDKCDRRSLLRRRRQRRQRSHLARRRPRRPLSRLLAQLQLRRPLRNRQDAKGRYLELTSAAIDQA